ncbi:MAG: type II toxin-antitoxin system RelE/ParE family toxin [Clostridiales bacterium]|nr:type II toxin-antitoxin system RelE/ParE family toxin [Clostridiales bacterium]
MNTSNKQYRIAFTNDCIQEMNRINEYISIVLYAPISAKLLMKKIDTIIQGLKEYNKMYMIIKQYKELTMEFRRIMINNYVIIYTISEHNNTVYIVHMYYSRSNYLNKI